MNPHASKGPYAVDLPRLAAGRIIDITDQQGNVIAQTTNLYPRQVAEANARLLAASWKMRAELKNLAAWLIAPDTSAATLRDLRESIVALLAEIDGGTR